MLSFLRQHKLALLFILIYLTYCVILIWKASFFVQGERYFSLFDDEMVSMRYAHNLAHGAGLVWNAGRERVEGISNPLWTLYMTLFHFLPIPLTKISLLIQISCIVFSLGTFYFVYQIAAYLAPKSQLPAILSIFFTAFYFPFTNWGVILGTEVTILCLILSSSVFFMLRQLKQKTFSLLPFFLLGIATFIRLDTLIPITILLSYSMLVDKKNRKKVVLQAFPLIASCLFLQEFIRISFYHALLPNTYYLKMTGFPLLLRVTRGLYVALSFINPLLLVVPFFSVIFWRKKEELLLLALFGGQILYSIYVGGDLWEHFGGSNRYITLGMPFFFILFSLTLFRLRALFLTSFPKVKSHIQTLAWVGVLIICFIVFNTSTSQEFVQWLGIKESYMMGENRYQVDLAATINNITDKNAKIATALAGVAPYFSDRYYVDLLGKNDTVIAHEKVADNLIPQNKLKRFITYVPGHMKYDTAYSLSHYQPDIVTHTIDEATEKRLQKDYIPVNFHNQFLLYLKKSSPHILWKQIEKEQERYIVK